MTALPAGSSERANERAKPGALAAMMRRARVTYDEFGVAAIPLDAFVVVLAGLVTGGAYDLISQGRTHDSGACWLISAISAASAVVLMYFKRAYESDRVLSSDAQIASIVSAWCIALLFALALCASLGANASPYQGWLPSFAIAAPALILGNRLLLQGLFLRGLNQGWTGSKHVLVITDVTEASHRRQPAHHPHEIALTHALPSDDRIGEFCEQIAGVLAGDQFINEVQIVIDWANWSRGKRVLHELSALPVSVRLIADSNAAEILKYRQRVSCGTVSFELQREPLTLGARIAKRLFDVASAGLGLLALAPILIVVAIAIRVDSAGPVLFRQKRGGFNGRTFYILKFRTMRVLEDGARVKQATRHDDRVTRVGKILRWSSIDELPQLINVLRGDMSLVGPRPHALAHDAAYRAQISSYPFRQFVKPGITGWAQVNGFRGETPTIASMKQRVDLDLWYARNCSFLLDMRILVETVREVCHPRNAF